MEEILKIINEILEGKGRSQLTKLESGLHLRDDIGLDSFDLAELTVIVEDKYGIDIFANGIVYTIGEVYELIKKYL